MRNFFYPNTVLPSPAPPCLPQGFLKPLITAIYYTSFGLFSMLPA